jgi:8-oxo-dGTP pyrophosphatase MutT (NUDIX family)
MWQTIAGSGVLVVRDGKLLMVAHERDGLTRWELPSGRVDAGETFERTAERETLEETGIGVSIGSLLCTVVMDVPVEEYRGVNLYFRANAVDHTLPRPPDDEPISCAAYIELASLRPRDIHPVDRRILNLWRRKPDRSPYFVHVTL